MDNVCAILFIAAGRSKTHIYKTRTVILHKIRATYCFEASLYYFFYLYFILRGRNTDIFCLCLTSM